MKCTCVFLLFLLPSLFAKSQEPAEGVFPLKDSAIYYEIIVVIDSTPKEDIYKTVKSWGVNAFKSQKDVLQVDDKEIGLIAYKYWFEEIFTAVTETGAKVSSNWKYNATMKIFLKDGKAKIVVQNLELQDADGLPSSILTIMADTERKIKELESSDKTYSKYSKKINKSEIMKQWFLNTKRHFEAVNKSISTTMGQLTQYLKSSKSEFDF